MSGSSAVTLHVGGPRDEADFASEAARVMGGALLRLPPGGGGWAAWQQALEEHQPESVFVHDVADAAPEWMLGLRERGIPYVVFLHDYGALCPTTRLWHVSQSRCGGPGRTAWKCAWCAGGGRRGGAGLPRRFWRYRHRPGSWRTALLRAEALLVDSRFAREFWIEQGAPPERLAVIEPWIAERTQPSVPVVSNQILYAEGPDEAAGAELLGAALDLVRQPLRVVAAGNWSDDEKAGMRAAIAPRHELGFPGELGEGALAALAAGSAATVVPMRWEIPYSRRVSLAQAAGGRVVATAVGGIPEQIIHGVNGYLAAPDDPGALAESLAEALRPPEVAWAGADALAAARRGAAAQTAACLRRLQELLRAGAAQAAVELGHRAWLDAVGPSDQERQRGIAQLVAAMRDGDGYDSSAGREVDQTSRHRRIQLNHAVAFLRACGCRRVARLGSGADAPAEAWCRTWGLEPVAATELPDALLVENDTSPDWGRFQLLRRFPQARGAVVLGAEVETLALHDENELSQP